MEKLLVIASLGHKAYSKWLFQRLVVRACMLVGLVFIIAILLSALLIGLLFAAHTALLHRGVEPQMAMLIISMTTLSIIMMLLLLARRYLRQLPRMLSKQSPVTARISDVFHAFMDGLMEK